MRIKVEIKTDKTNLYIIISGLSVAIPPKKGIVCIEEYSLTRPSLMSGYIITIHCPFRILLHDSIPGFTNGDQDT